MQHSGGPSIEVDLSNFLSGAENTVASLIAAEHSISRAFASAANTACDTAPCALYGDTQLHAAEPVAVQLNIGAALDAWDRSSKDAVLRCVDRAVARIYPPLDTAQYLHKSSPVFLTTHNERAVAALHDEKQRRTGLRAIFLVQPSALLIPASLLKPHRVEGDAMTGLPRTASLVNAAGAIADTQASLADMDLWNRARAANMLHGASFNLHREPPGDGAASLPFSTMLNDVTIFTDEQNELQKKKVLLQWQLARWLTELFLNEGGWARTCTSPSAGGGKVGREGIQCHNGVSSSAVRRLFHSPLRTTSTHVVEAALRFPRDGVDAGAAAPGGRRFLHADVRGMEWDGLLLGHTGRYAYIAVPSFASPTKGTASSSCTWSLVGRIPVPAVVTATAVGGDHDGDPRCAGGVTRRKRSRPSTSVEEAQCLDRNEEIASRAAREVLGLCLNKEEVMRHDTDAETVFRLEERPFVVTVRAHRVYCAHAAESTLSSVGESTRRNSASPSHLESAPSPQALSLVFDDAYAVHIRQAMDDFTGSFNASPSTSVADATSPHWAQTLLSGVSSPLGGHEKHADGDDTGAGEPRSLLGASSLSAVARAVHCFPDLVNVVRESCRRFLRTHEHFRALYQRSSDMVTGAALPLSSEEKVVPARTATNVRDTPAPGPHTGITAPEVSSISLAAATQQQLLLRRAEKLYSAISDTVSVHFKKLRRAAIPSIPSIRTVSDIAAVEEGHQVELKAKVRLPRGASPHTSSPLQRSVATMDTERLRNTMAAMASCGGGLIIIGVADDGRIIGHAKQLQVMKQLRVSGFCPAMVKDTVRVKELRWLGEIEASSSPEPGSGTRHGDAATPPVKRGMPENWWKGTTGRKSSWAGGSHTTACADSSASGAFYRVQAATSSADEELVVTVVTVEKGQAPFYATGRNALPYQRGCASTVTMPTLVMANRIMNGLM